MRLQQNKQVSFIALGLPNKRKQNVDETMSQIAVLEEIAAKRGNRQAKVLYNTAIDQLHGLVENEAERLGNDFRFHVTNDLRPQKLSPRTAVLRTPEFKPVREKLGQLHCQIGRPDIAAIYEP